MTDQYEHSASLAQKEEAKARHGKLMLLFKGAISQNTITRLGGLLHLTYEEAQEDMSKKRLFSILVEMTQNILHYSQEKEFFPRSKTVVGAGTVHVEELPSQYEVECTNLINADQKGFLEDHCALINSMNQEKLREYYLSQRHKSDAPNSRGAGLGLIEIARKSKNPLVVQFTPGPDQLYYYTISTRLNRDSLSN